MTGGRASRGMSPDAGAAVSSNTPAQLVPHAVGDRKVPQVAWIVWFIALHLCSSYNVLSCRDMDLHGFFL